MRRISLLCVTCAAAMMVAGGCASMSGTLKGGLIGGGGGTDVGAGIGALAGGGKGAAIGAGVGLALGATAGALIGRKMEKQKAELAAIEGAEVETVTDTNGLDAIKVTFDTGISSRPAGRRSTLRRRQRSTSSPSACCRIPIRM